MSARRLRYRISCQPTGVLGVDRWVCIFVGEPSSFQMGKQKGLWYSTGSLPEAEQLVKRLMDAAQKACTAGKAQVFLDAWNTCIVQQKKTKASPAWLGCDPFPPNP